MQVASFGVDAGEDMGSVNGGTMGVVAPLMDLERGLTTTDLVCVVTTG